MDLAPAIFRTQVSPRCNAGNLTAVQGMSLGPHPGGVPIGCQLEGSFLSHMHRQLQQTFAPHTGGQVSHQEAAKAVSSHVTCRPQGRVGALLNYDNFPNAQPSDSPIRPFSSETTETFQDVSAYRSPCSLIINSAR